MNRQWVRNDQETSKLRLLIAGEKFDGNTRLLKMPDYGKGLKDAEIADLVTYIRQLGKQKQRAGGSEPILELLPSAVTLP